MKNIESLKQYIKSSIYFTVLLCLSIESAFSQDESFDELSLNGLSTFTQLRNEYYIGGLYLEGLNPDAESILYSDGKMRMQLRITIDKWPPRRFARQWNQLILINNEQDALNKFSDQILSFIDMPKKDLMAGDIITIDRDPEQGTSVYLNDKKVIDEKDNEFFSILLSTWIGNRPPSSDFKNSLLTLSTNAESTELLTRFESINPSDNRKNSVAKWFSATPSSNKNSSNNNDAFSPPGINTKPPGDISSVKARKVANTSTDKVTNSGTATKQTVKIEKPAIKFSGPVTVAAKKKTPPNEDLIAKLQAKVLEQQKAAEKLAFEMEQKDLFESYQASIVRLTRSKTEYPQRAIDRDQKGQVVVAIKLNRNGELLEVIESEPSRYSLLNKAAVKAVKKSASSFPKAPEKLVGEEIELTLPFNFQF